MTIDEIRFRIWTINETVLHLGDICERSTDEESNRQRREHIEQLEAEKKQLFAQWRGLEAIEERKQKKIAEIEKQAEAEKKQLFEN